MYSDNHFFAIKNVTRCRVPTAHVHTCPGVRRPPRRRPPGPAEAERRARGPCPVRGRQVGVVRVPGPRAPCPRTALCTLNAGLCMAQNNKQTIHKQYTNNNKQTKTKYMCQNKSCWYRRQKYSVPVLRAVPLSAAVWSPPIVTPWRVQSCPGAWVMF